MHQLNLEWLSTLVWLENVEDLKLARPDTLLGTDSHTPMVGGLGVLGWGVGGIEAQAAMLGQSTLVNATRVVGMRLSGAQQKGITATDVVLHVAQFLPECGRRQLIHRGIRRRRERAANRDAGDDLEHGPRIRGNQRLFPD